MCVSPTTAPPAPEVVRQRARLGSLHGPVRGGGLCQPGGEEADELGSVGNGHPGRPYADVVVPVREHELLAIGMPRHAQELTIPSSILDEEPSTTGAPVPRHELIMHRSRADVHRMGPGSDLRRLGRGHQPGELVLSDLSGSPQLAELLVDDLRDRLRAMASDPLGTCRVGFARS